MEHGRPATSEPPSGDDVDQRVILHGVAWKDYEAVLAMRGESSAVRVTYLEGSLELMSPSTNHELDKTKLARLLEAYADELGIELEGYGSWTVKSKRKKRGAEADECYVVGAHDPEAIRAPQIAIEVVWTSGGLSKLDVWRKLGAEEVWFWVRGKLRIHLLRGEQYVEAARSERLAQIDPALLERCMQERTQTAAVRALRAALRSA